METECTADQLEFHGLGRRVVVGGFNGGKISSDSGGLLLREVEQRTHILKRFAGCFVDYRDADQIEHPVESLIKQRVMGLALGYEDLNDHDALRQDLFWSKNSNRLKYHSLSDARRRLESAIYCRNAKLWRKDYGLHADAGVHHRDGRPRTAPA